MHAIPAKCSNGLHKKKKYLKKKLNWHSVFTFTVEEKLGQTILFPDSRIWLIWLIKKLFVDYKQNNMQTQSKNPYGNHNFLLVIKNNNCIVAVLGFHFCFHTCSVASVQMALVNASFKLRKQRRRLNCVQFHWVSCSSNTIILTSLVK